MVKVLFYFKQRSKSPDNLFVVICSHRIPVCKHLLRLMRVTHEILRDITGSDDQNIRKYHLNRNYFQFRWQNPTKYVIDVPRFFSRRCQKCMKKARFRSTENLIRLHTFSATNTKQHKCCSDLRAFGFAINFSLYKFKSYKFRKVNGKIEIPFIIKKDSISFSKTINFRSVQ